MLKFLIVYSTKQALLIKLTSWCLYVFLVRGEHCDGLYVKYVKSNNLFRSYLFPMDTLCLIVTFYGNLENFLQIIYNKQSGIPKFIQLKDNI